MSIQFEGSKMISMGTVMGKIPPTPFLNISLIKPKQKEIKYCFFLHDRVKSI